MTIKNIFFPWNEKVLSERAALANQNQFIVDQDTTNKRNPESDGETLISFWRKLSALIPSKPKETIPVS